MRNFLAYTQFLLILFTHCAFAQSGEWKEISKEQAAQELNKALNWFSINDNYSLSLTHSSYKDYSTAIPYEVQKGYLKKYKRNYHSLIAGIHTIQNDKYRIVADTVKKYMMLANASDILLDPIGIEQLLANLKQCSSIKTLATTNEISYRLEYGQQNMQRMEVKLGKEGLLKEMIYYINKEVKNEDRSSYSFVQARLLIRLDNYKTNLKHSSADFAESAYISWKENKPQPAGKFSAYEFFDSRAR